MDSEAASALIIDDEPAIREVTARMLKVLGINATQADGGKNALSILEKESFGVVLLDLNMPGTGGVETLARIREIRPDIHVIMMTGGSSEETRSALGANLVQGYLMKPFRLSHLKEAVGFILD